MLISALPEYYALSVQEKDTETNRFTKSMAKTTITYHFRSFLTPPCFHQTSEMFPQEKTEGTLPTKNTQESYKDMLYRLEAPH